MDAKLAKVIANGFAVILAFTASATDLESPLNLDGREAIRVTYGMQEVYFTWGLGGNYNFIPEGVNIGGDTTPPNGGLLVRGRTGIGTLNPQADLHVQGDGNFADFKISPDGTDESSRLTMCQDPACVGASVWRYDGVRNSLYLYFQSSGGYNGWTEDRIPLMVEHHAANPARVGINVPKDHNIRHELEVRGTVLAEEIEVVANVADYVFGADFHLMDLDEVERFIAENRHLPGIPSESEVFMRGGTVSLGEAFTTMVQKIEELTLYTIQQHKTLREQQHLLSAQREEIKKMKAEIDSLPTIASRASKSKP